MGESQEAAQPQPIETRAAERTYPRQPGPLGAIASRLVAALCGLLVAVPVGVALRVLFVASGEMPSETATYVVLGTFGVSAVAGHLALGPLLATRESWAGGIIAFFLAATAAATLAVWATRDGSQAAGALFLIVGVVVLVAFYTGATGTKGLLPHESIASGTFRSAHPPLTISHPARADHHFLIRGEGLDAFGETAVIGIVGGHGAVVTAVMVAELAEASLAAYADLVQPNMGERIKISEAPVHLAGRARHPSRVVRQERLGRSAAARDADAGGEGAAPLPGDQHLGRREGLARAPRARRRDPREPPHHLRSSPAAQGQRIDIPGGGTRRARAPARSVDAPGRWTRIGSRRRSSASGRRATSAAERGFVWRGETLAALGHGAGWPMVPSRCSSK